MKNEPVRDSKESELSLLKLLFPTIFGEHAVCVKCDESKRADEAIYPLSQLTKVGADYYCAEHIPPLPQG
jgi:hypothetical protein